MPKKYPPIAIIRARQLRREMTEAERAMWSILREHFPNYRFRKQAPILNYIVDFASHRVRIVIEVDGGQHSQERDAHRDTAIAAEGYRILRFWNADVLASREGVTRSLLAELV